MVNSTFVNSGTSLYSDPGNWSPPEVPSNTATRHYNVSIGEGSWVHADIDTAVSNLALSGTVYISDRNLVVEETTTLDTASIVVAASSAPASFNTGALSAFSGGTLQGNYSLYSQGNSATLQFDGANINALSHGFMRLYGPLARVIDENGNDALRNLARVENNATLTLGGNNLTTLVPFSNLGEVKLGDAFDVTLFEAAGGLDGFDPATRTISGGTFFIGFRAFDGQNSALTEFRFAGADIVNNGSDIHLAGPLSRITDLEGRDGLRNLAHNLATGSLTFLDHDLTTIGSFRNDGWLWLSASTFTVVGPLDNFDPATGTLSGGIYKIGAGAVLKFSNADIRRNAALIDIQQSQITDLAGNDALRNFRDNLDSGSFTVGTGRIFTASGDFSNAGRIATSQAFIGIREPTWVSGEFRVIPGSTYTQTAGETSNGGTFSASQVNIAGGTFSGFGTVKGNLSVTKATIVPGGTIEGNLTLGAEAHVPTANSRDGGHRWSKITGTASLAGTLEVQLVGQPFLSNDVITLLQSTGGVSGTFRNAPHGARITTVDGSASFVVLYGPNEVKLTDFQALPPPAQLLNISTRAFLSRGDDDPYSTRSVLIGGFIISGVESKKVVVRGLGPSLAKAGLSPTLANPTLELHQAEGAATTIASNDDWADAQENEIAASGLSPDDPREAVVIATLDPGMYTVVIREKNGLGGHGLVEVYDLAAKSNSKLGNISTRGFTDGANLLIGGIIAAGDGPANAEIVVRALGPQLRRHGILNALEDPTLEVRNANGGVIAFNDNWFANHEAIPSQFHPHHDRESAMRLSLPQGNYTALVRAKANSGGVALVEFYDLRR